MAASPKPLLLAHSSLARGPRPCRTTVCRYGDRTAFAPTRWEPGGQGLPRGLGAAPGPHRPCVAGLLQCLARGPLGGLHGPQDAAVGVGGLHGPLDEAVLVDSANDAVGEAGQGPGLCDRGLYGSGPARGPPTLTAARPSCPAPAGTMASPSGNPPAASCLLKASTALQGLSRGAPPRAPHLERLWASWSSRHAWASAASTRSTFPLAGKKARIFSSSGVRAPSRLAARCSDSWGGRASVEPPSRPLTRDPSLAPHTRDPRGHALHAKQRLATPTAPPQGRPAHLLGLVHVLQEL